LIESASTVHRNYFYHPKNVIGPTVNFRGGVSYRQ
jgi:hypothetical protein